MWQMVRPKRIFLAPGAINMRLGIDGLTKIAVDRLGGDLSEGDMVVFCNKKKDAVKILHFNGDYDLFHYKPEKRPMAWPSSGDFRPVTKAELERFFDTGAVITSC